MKVTCPYCHRDARLVTGSVVYPHRPDLFHKRFWHCAPCEAYVGCHTGTEKPLGRLANSELRREKIKAHAAFDPIWKSKEMARKEAYAWLSEQLGISPANTHIGMFDVDDCRAVVAVCEARKELA